MIQFPVVRPLLGAVLAALMITGLTAPSTAAPVALRAETAATGSPAAADGIGIRLLDVPVATQNDPRAASYIIDHVNPGEMVERRVQVSNSSAEEQSVRVYATAARVVDGSFLPYDETPNELSTWIKIGQDRTADTKLDLAPGAKTEALVTIDVPQDAAEGEQYAAVWAEVRNGDDEEGQVALANRAGIRVYLSVGPGNGPAADFSIGTLTTGHDENDAPMVTADITNTGGRAVDVTGELTLAEGPGGISAGPFAVDSGTTIAPGATGQVHIKLNPEIPHGPWQGTLQLTSGLLTKETTAELTFSESSGPVAGGQGLSPWWLLAAAALILLALAVFLRMRRATDQATDPQV